MPEAIPKKRRLTPLHALGNMYMLANPDPPRKATDQRKIDETKKDFGI